MLSHNQSIENKFNKKINLRLSLQILLMQLHAVLQLNWKKKKKVTYGKLKLAYEIRTYCTQFLIHSSWKFLALLIECHSYIFNFRPSAIQIQSAQPIPQPHQYCIDSLLLRSSQYKDQHSMILSKYIIKSKL